MKQKIKTLVAFFASSLKGNDLSIQEVSIFFSVFIATIKLRRINLGKNIHYNYVEFHKEFSREIALMAERFPKLILTFKKVGNQVDGRLIAVVFDKLQTAFDNSDEDADDIISWSYQFLKRDLEKTAFKKVGANNVKLEGSDLLFTTQFFTDKYMVKYLVNKSLETVNKENIEKLAVIDCASGGGNFLIYSFEVLFKHYLKFRPKWSNRKIVSAILNNSLVGYDLDENLANISSLSLFVKACQYAIPNASTSIHIYGGSSNDNLGFLNRRGVLSTKINGKTFSDKLSDLTSKNFLKIYLTNPPFMGKRDMDTDLKNYLIAQYPESKGDLCVSFIQRTIELMNGRDSLGVVAQNNWMSLSSLKGFRELFLNNQILSECIDLGSNAFEDINGEKTSVGLFFITKSKGESSTFKSLKYTTISEKRDLLLNNSISNNVTFKLNQKRFLKNSNFEFNYQLEHRFENIQKLRRYSVFANPMQGTSTGNNAKFVKFAWEVNGSPDWKLVSKGGGFSKWAGLNYYKVHWGKNAELIKANEGSALRNISRISSTQLVFSDTGTLGLNVRVLKDDQVFIASGPGIQVLDGNKYAHLAFLNSRIATFLLKLLNPKFTISAGYISMIPVAENILNSKLIAEKSKQCLELKENYLRRKLPNFEFEHTDYHAIDNLESYLEEQIINDLESDYKRLALEFIIEKEIRRCYAFKEKELTEIKSVVGESPFFYTKRNLELTAEQLDKLISGSMDLNCFSTSRAINGYSVGSESIFEDLSYKLGVNPDSIMELFKRNISQLIATKNKYFNDLLHKIILSELGVKKISIYKFQICNMNNFVKKLMIKYSFLNSIPELDKSVAFVLNVHHKLSFFNKPLISISGKSLSVGEVHHA